MKCPKCKKKLTRTPASLGGDQNSTKEDFCIKCWHRYTDDELKKLNEKNEKNK